MKLSEFDFALPPHLIAKYPSPVRSESRLMVLRGGEGSLKHEKFSGLLQYIEEGDLLVFNNSKVIPARLFGEKSSGGHIEVLVERLLGERHCLAHVRASKPLKPGQQIILEKALCFEVVGRNNIFYELRLLHEEPLLPLLEQYGRIPLPPYLNREEEETDKERYQTVYAHPPGSVAAPTAGLHFDIPLLEALKAKGVSFAFLTLHVGAGTFQPVRAEEITQHEMHPEWLTVPEAVINAVEDTRRRGKKVIAVGTTSVRSLETAASSGILKPFSGDSRLFIYPGYSFKVVDAILTNFHLPKSSLMMLISAFAGLEEIRKAYEEAIASQYRFFSYGDAMLIL